MEAAAVASFWNGDDGPSEETVGEARHRHWGDGLRKLVLRKDKSFRMNMKTKKGKPKKND